MAAEKPAKPAEAAPAAADEKPKKGGMMKMVIVAAVVLALEGATVGVTMKISAGPQKVVAEVPVAASQPAERDAEVKLVEATLPNNVGGRLFYYDLGVVVKVDEKNKVKITELFAEREAETRDHIRTIIASSDPKALAEPGLETLRRQIAYQLDETLGKDGKGLIKEVLIPKCTPRPASY